MLGVEVAVKIEGKMFWVELAEQQLRWGFARK